VYIQLSELCHFDTDVMLYSLCNDVRMVVYFSSMIYGKRSLAYHPECGISEKHKLIGFMYVIIDTLLHLHVFRGVFD